MILVYLIENALHNDRTNQLMSAMLKLLSIWCVSLVPTLKWQLLNQYLITLRTVAKKHLKTCWGFSY